jgi:hypothetical protein
MFSSPSFIFVRSFFNASARRKFATGYLDDMHSRFGHPRAVSGYFFCSELFLAACDSTVAAIHPFPLPDTAQICTVRACQGFIPAQTKAPRAQDGETRDWRKYRIERSFTHRSSALFWVRWSETPGQQSRHLDRIQASKRALASDKSDKQNGVNEISVSVQRACSFRQDEAARGAPTAMAKRQSCAKLLREPSRGPSS